MKKKIAILGSTGSIGTQTLDILKKEKNKIDIILLAANKNSSLLIKQIKEFKVKNVIIKDIKGFNLIKKKFPKIKVFNDFKTINSSNNIKFDYVMSAISGLNGLEPTIDIIKKTKVIAIANKESIICAWNLISRELKKYNTLFIPVDSEHFSIWQLIKYKNKKNIREIFLTASGGPFLFTSIKKLHKIKFEQAIKHPSWSMGNKISVDSSTLMNKVFEVIEARNIFDIEINKFKIIIHPNSYIHSIVNYNSGFSEMLFHPTDMKIPINNSLNMITIFSNNFKKSVNFKVLNNLDFRKVDISKFSSVKILKLVPKDITLFNTVLIASNDILVDFFKMRKIKFMQITKYVFKIINLKKYSYTRLKKPSNLREINNLMDDVFNTAHDICNVQKYE